MELGATVCLPREPHCQVCPVQKWCATRKFSQEATGVVTMERRASPPSRRRISVPQVKKSFWCALNQKNGNILLVQRSNKSSLMPGMWELPMLPNTPPPVPDSAPWRTFRHSITITDYTVHVLRNSALRNNVLRNMVLPEMDLQNSPIRSASLPPAYAEGKGMWIAADRIRQVPITGLTRKILKAAGII
jgi:A/G-specific adenine glycosylase